MSQLQTSIFDAFQKLHDLSRQQHRMKHHKNILLLSEVIEISDESDCDVTAKTPRLDTSVNRKLPFDFSDDSDEGEGPSNAKCTSRKRFSEIMVVNRPITSSTHMQIKKESKDDGSSSDSTIILDSSIEERITIQQCISITPKIINRTPTKEKEGKFTTASIITGRLKKPAKSEQALPNSTSQKSCDKNNIDSSPSNKGKSQIIDFALSRPQGCNSSLEKGKENGSAQDFTESGITPLEVSTPNSKVASSSKSVSTITNSNTEDNSIQTIAGGGSKAMRQSYVSKSPTQHKVTTTEEGSPKKQGFAKISESPVRNDGLQNHKKDQSKPSTSKSGSSDVIEDSDGPRNSDAHSDGGSAFPKSPSTPKKRKSSDSLPSSPNKTIKFSPKKEKRMNHDCTKVMKELFSSVFESSFLKDLIKEETPKLMLIISGNQTYFYVILKLLIYLPKWYNIFRFCEKINLELDGKEVLELYKFLSENDIVDVDFKTEKIHNLLRFLDHSSVKSICETFKVKRTLKTKEDMIPALLKFCNTQSTLTFSKSAKDLILEEIELKLGKCVKLKESFREAFYRVFLLGTFTNYDSLNIQDYFRNELYTKTAYPEYKVEDYVVFYSRNEFLSYATARRYREDLEKAMENKNHVEALQISETIFKNLKSVMKSKENEERYRDAPHLKMFTAQSTYRSALSFACEFLKTKFYDEVKDWLEYLIKKFPDCHRAGLWYFHLTWLYMRYLKPINYKHSADLLINILGEKRDCLSEVQLQMLGERGEQLKVAKKYKIDQFYHDVIADLVPEPIMLEHFPETTVDAKAIRSNETGRKRKYLVHDTEGNKNYLSVESIALEYYIDRCRYTGGVHCEGRLIKASFTLFFWDLIYNPETIVPGTFLSKRQSIPLDMMTTYFYTNRKNAIDQRLHDIASRWSDSETIEFVKHSFDMHSHERGLCEPGELLEDVGVLEILVNCVGRNVLSKIYERLVKNIREYRSGMPDLFLWNAENKKSKFVEVKGENDKLSVKQTLWLKYLKSIGADIEVCHVHSIGSKRKKTKKLESTENVSDETEKAQVSPSKRGKPKRIDKAKIEKEKMPSASSSSSSKSPKKSGGKINKDYYGGSSRSI
ncbi:hypothetical protein JTB14_028293 [Gonioctena quinquepunctata]|nr:hypothetical protein JTB14_028293 [Gonioctena quinquepunctata]